MGTQSGWPRPVFPIETGSAPAPYPALLYALCHHDDIVHVLLPHHLPEVILGSGQRPLSGDVLPPEVVTLKGAVQN